MGLGAATFAISGCTGDIKLFTADRSGNKPNILWLMAEDIGPELSCYGTELVQTPNLDKLAGQGIRYTSAFVTSPVCSPSRSAMITGMYQTTIGAHNHRSHRDDGYTLPEPVRLITDYLRQAGYFTANVDESGKTGKTDFNFTTENKPFDGKYWKQRRPGQPFFAQVTFMVTHRPFTRDKNNPIDPDNIKLPPYYPDHPVARRDWADYLESIQLFDTQLGRVMKRLDKDGLTDNTVVIFIGDNGRCHVRGKQWLYDGGIRIPLIIRWPGKLEAGQVCDDMVSAIDISATVLKIAGIEPPEYMEGRVFLGPNANKREYIIAARDRCDETIDRIRCVRTKRYKYIRNFMPERPYTQPNAYKEQFYPVLKLLKDLYGQGKLTPAQALFMAPRKPDEELYDLRNDPHEIHNLADSPQHQETLKKMRAILGKWIEDPGDKGRFPEKEIWLPLKKKWNNEKK